ncbi:MAG: hypothetical protein ABII01_04330 [Candidatus Woesearchaeota archaeon]
MKQSRRQFMQLPAIAAGLVGLEYLAMQNSASAAAQETKSEFEKITQEDFDKRNIEYKILTEIDVYACWGAIPVVTGRLRVEKEWWESLPEGLSKQELFDKLKKQKIQYEIQTVLTGKDLTNELITSDSRGFLSDAKRFQKEKKPKLGPELDSNVEFNQESYDNLEHVLSWENFRGSVSKEKRKYIWWGPSRTVYYFAAGSRVRFETTPDEAAIQTYTICECGYQVGERVVITDPAQVKAMRDMTFFSILHPDPKGGNSIPMNWIFQAYQDKTVVSALYSTGTKGDTVEKAAAELTAGGLLD